MKTNIDLGNAFEINALKGVVLQGFDQPQPGTPAVNADYRFPMDAMRRMVGFFMLPHGETSIGMMLSGHKGAGKTAFVQQFHARLGLPLYVLMAREDATASDMFGNWKPKGDGTLEFRYSAIVRAAQEGASVLIDEFNLMMPSTATALNLLLEGKPQFIEETGEWIVPQPGFRVFATQNPADLAGTYNGRKMQDAATTSRFRVISMEGYPEEHEKDIILNVFKRLAPTMAVAQAGQFADMMLEVCTRIRKSFVGVSNDAGALTNTLSTRELIRWAEDMCLFKNVRASTGESCLHYSLKGVFTNNLPIEERMAVHQILTDVSGEAERP